MNDVLLEFTDTSSMNSSDYGRWDSAMSMIGYNYGIRLLVDDAGSVESLVKDNSYLIRLLDDEIELLNNDEELCIQRRDVIKRIKNSIDELPDNVGLVSLDFENVDHIEFIKNNPFLHNKKILVNDYISIKDCKQSLKILEKYKDYKDNIYFRIANNTENVSYEECYNTINYIESIAMKIEKLELSPLEQLMYIYDIVRDRVYNGETEDESFTVSRDLSSIINTDKIVCVGYSALFDTLANRLGFHGECVNLFSTDQNVGHERNYLYVKDDKYDVDGIYFFDTTYDSRKSEDDSDYLRSYLFFAKTGREIRVIDNNDYDDKLESYFATSLVEEFNKMLKSNDVRDNFNKLKSINRIVRFCNEELDFDSTLFFPSRTIPIKTKRHAFNVLEHVDQKLNNQIPAETYIRLVNNVRRIEHSENPIKYPYPDEFIRIAYIYSLWEFEGEYSYVQKIKSRSEKPLKYIEFKNMAFDKFISRVNLEGKKEDSSTQQIKIKSF